MGTSDASTPGFLGRFRLFSKITFFIMIYTASCAFNFGYDVGNFGGVQGMQSFGKVFGKYYEAKGVYALPASLSSVMTSVPFIAKAVGVAIGGWVAQRFGRKIAIAILIALCFIGVTLQTSATTAAQFTLGRCLNFAATGLTIVVVPIYLAETSPRELRGMMNSTIQLMIVLGQVVASLINLRTKTIESNAGWQIPVGIQFVPAFVLAVLWPVLPESPRWLLSQDRAIDAVKSMQKLSKKGKSLEEIEQEVAALQHDHANEAKGTWAEVFDKQNRRRTAVAVLVMFGQQITGQAFVSQYSVIFYQQQGFRSQAFLFTVINNVVGLICLLFTWFIVDAVGRRPILLSGAAMMAIFLFILGGLSTASNPSEAARHMSVASVMLFGAGYNISWAPVSYIVVSEAASTRVKEKTNLLACVISVLTTFLTSFTIPYLINAQYAGLGGKVGFVYGSICAVMFVMAFLFIPELKNRSLEEVDQLFASGASLRKFGSIKTERVEQIYVEEIHEAKTKGIDSV